MRQKVSTLNTFERSELTCLLRQPDWHAAEVIRPRDNDYYRSDKALGRLYRNIQIREVEALSGEEAASTTGADAITKAIERRAEDYLDDSLPFENDLVQLFKRYAEELRYICTTHTVSNTPGVELIEEEVVVGTILAKCSQNRWRRDRIGTMNLHMSQLIHTVERGIRWGDPDQNLEFRGVAAHAPRRPRDATMHDSPTLH